MKIKEFLAKKPGLSEIFNFVENESQRIVSEKKKIDGDNQGVRT
ncbi:Uncharacterised protein [uncultured archaeon]|nr:Uncharacterised protein [uncultured archaeon]